MTNKNIFEIINKLTSTTNGNYSEDFTAREIFTAIAHGYCYIRPGKDTAKFLDKIDNISEKYWSDRKKMYSKSKDGIPFEKWLWWKMSREYLDVIREMFAERTLNYFREAMKDDMKNVYDNELLEDYLYHLDMKELKQVFEGIVTFKESNNFFLSDENYKLMMEEFKECSIYVAEQGAVNQDDFKEHVDYINKTPMFFFNYLCREIIIDIIYRHIDIDPILLAHMIKAYIYTESTNTAAEYTGIAAKLMYGYDIDIFGQEISD